MGILRGKKKCLEALRVTGVVAASTGTHTHTYTHGGSWPALGKQDLVLAGNPEDPGAAPKTWQLQKPLEVDTQCPWGLASVHEIRPRFPSLLAHTVKNLPAGNTGLIPGLGRSYGEGAGNPLQYFAWRIPWTEDEVMGSWGHRVGHDWGTNTTTDYLCTLLPWVSDLTQRSFTVGETQLKAGCWSELQEIRGKCVLPASPQSSPANGNGRVLPDQCDQPRKKVSLAKWPRKITLRGAQS